MCSYFVKREILSHFTIHVASRVVGIPSAVSRHLWICNPNSQTLLRSCSLLLEDVVCCIKTLKSCTDCWYHRQWNHMSPMMIVSHWSDIVRRSRSASLQSCQYSEFVRVQSSTAHFEWVVQREAAKRLDLLTSSPLFCISYVLFCWKHTHLAAECILCPQLRCLALRRIVQSYSCACFEKMRTWQVASPGTALTKKNVYLFNFASLVCCAKCWKNSLWASLCARIELDCGF